MSTNDLPPVGSNAGRSVISPVNETGGREGNQSAGCAPDECRQTRETQAPSGPMEAGGAEGPNDSSDAAAQYKDSSGFFSQNERSWPDDARDEDNGSYQNICCSCQKLFIGHKDRVMCKACFLANPDVAAALASERAKSEQAFALVDEYEAALHAKDKENTQLRATVARLENNLRAAEAEREGGDGVIANLKAEIARLEGELAEAKEAIGYNRRMAADYGKQLAAEKAAHEETKRDLEAAKRERDEQTARADDLLDTLGKTVEKICYTEEVAKEAEAATGSKLVSDGIKWWFDQKSTDRDALAAQVEERTRALEKVAALINESTGVAGLHLNGEVAPWCDLMTGGKYEGWLCGVFESLELDAPTALRERLEAETKPLVEALEEVRLDLQTTIYLYERNGPQWTSRETGHEYYDASYVIESARDKIEKIDTALAETKARLEGGK